MYTWTAERLAELASRRASRLTVAEICAQMAISVNSYTQGIKRLKATAPEIGQGGPPRTLKNFQKDQKRAVCKVCALPPEVKTQLRDASRELVVAWLGEDYHVNVTIEDLDRHRNERH